MILLVQEPWLLKGLSPRSLPFTGLEANLDPVLTRCFPCLTREQMQEIRTELWGRGDYRHDQRGTADLSHWGKKCGQHNHIFIT